MRGALGGPRVLLRRLREVMAEPVSAQDRLDKIVVLIAANMVAEVCSVYVLRVDGTLELYATEGLKREAVHQTVLRQDEGLVGLVASEANPINLSEAQNHPAFSYRPETGEEVYHSFLGVPVLRGGNTLGVLVVQNRARRTYSEEEEEALQTTAMVLAEMIASGELQSLAQPGAEPAVRPRLHLTGTALADGIALGHVVLHEPRVTVKNVIADDVDKELKRLEEAVQVLRNDLDLMLERGEIADGGEHRDVLEAYRMFAHDQGWLHRLREAVSTGLTAEAGVERVQSDTRARMMRATDPYLRERLHDLDDLANRLMRQLIGVDHAPPREQLPDNAILVARSMGPAALLDYDRRKLRGLMLEEGGPTSHVTIVARALGIAAVGEVDNISGLVDTGDAVIVDGSTGEVHIRPATDIELAYGERVKLRARRQAQYRALRDRPCVTKDGQPINLMINAGPDGRPAASSPRPARSGIGLFRTELQFMIATNMPRIGEQLSLYRSVLDAAGDKPVTFRTLDIGGDKVLPYMREEPEEKPGAGLAGDPPRPRPARPDAQPGARAAAGRRRPRAQAHVPDGRRGERVRRGQGAGRARTDPSAAPSPQAARPRRGRRHGRGAVAAVPARRAGGAGGFPLGRLQRPDAVLLSRSTAATGASPTASIRFRRRCCAPCSMIVDKCRAAGKPVTLCGELASQPIGALALVALGFRALSLTPSALGAGQGDAARARRQEGRSACCAR